MYFAERQRRERAKTGGPQFGLYEAAGPSAKPGPALFIKHILLFKKPSFPAKANFKGINAQ